MTALDYERKEKFASYYTNHDNTFRKHTGVGLGNFDGLHIGHMALINTLISECKLNDLHSVVYTFTKHPRLCSENLMNQLITTNEQKTKILESTALDTLYYKEFDEDFPIVTRRVYKNILIDTLNVRLTVVGFNYRFGYKGKGDIEYLKKRRKVWF